MDLFMKTDLTPEQIAFYRENGFLVIPDFLAGEELVAWRQSVDEAVVHRDGRRLAKSDERSGDSYYDNVFIQRVNLWQDHEGMCELMLDARLGKLAAELAGVDGIRIWHDQALIKQPWGNPTAWHLDNPYWSFSSPNAISIWVALDDATLENGCLYFMPGTHKLATYDNVGIGQNMGDLFKVYTDWSKRKTVAAPMTAGSCSFHNGLVAHGAGANMTPGFRRAMTCAYMPDGSIFNGQQNILTDEQISQLKLGDTLEDDAQNPLIYHVSKSYVSLSQT
jgi:ectoine hydroxylase-related dioxygenase (phytanoyl-CoA dioxygenase family)